MGRFPAYAPELNPGEVVGQHVELSNLCCADFDHLSNEFHLAGRRLAEGLIDPIIFRQNGFRFVKEGDYQCNDYTDISCRVFQIKL